MDLFDRYLTAVKLFLPRAQQDDIIRELSEDIHARVEDRQAELGRPLTRAEEKELVRQLGHPALLAGRYGPRRHLIGAEMFPFYWLVLKLSLGANLLAQIIVVAAVVASGRSVNVGLRVFSAIAALFICFGIVTIVFALLDRYRPSTLGRRPWDPDRLPSLSARPYRGSHPVTRIVTGVLFLFWWSATKPFPTLVLGAGAERLAFGPAWAPMHAVVLVFALGSLAVACLELARPNWTRVRSVFRLVAAAGAVILMVSVLRGGDFVVVADTAVNSERMDNLVRIINQTIVWTLFSVAFISILVAVRELRLWMRRRGTGPPQDTVKQVIV
jgi:hypothetical protein